MCIAGEQIVELETKLTVCQRPARLSLYGHVGVFIDPLPETGFVLSTRKIYNRIESGFKVL